MLLISLKPAMAQEEMTSGFQILVNRGDDFIRQYEYEKAIDMYEKAAKVDRQNTSVKLKIAEAYYELHEYGQAEVWYHQFLDASPQKDPNIISHYIDVLKILKRYEEAKEWLAVYSKLTRNEQAQNELNFLDNLNYYKKQIDKYQVTNSKFNSPYNDFSPAYFKDSVVFVSNRMLKGTGQLEYYNLYVNARGTDSASAITNYFLGNNKHNDFHEGPLAFSRDYNRMYLTRTLEDKRSNKGDKMQLKIFRADRDRATNQWINFQLIDEVVPSGYTMAYPTLSRDGKTMYFVSNMPGGQGETDIYKTTWKDDVWSEPKHLGKSINTPGKEMFPFVHNDSVLYFASNGHPGLGGLDVFKVDLFGIDSGNVINLGTPINSAMDDFGYVLSEDGYEGYFSSARDGGRGGDDIYKFTIDKTEKLVFEGFTKQNGDQKNLVGDILFYDDVTKEKLGISDANGFFHIELENHHEYDVAVKSLSRGSDFFIHFEGFVKNEKDTSGIVNMKVVESRSGKDIARLHGHEYFVFNLEEGKDYEVNVHVDEDSKLPDSAVHLEGFVSGPEAPLVNLGEVRIYHGINKRLLFKSDAAGYFDYIIKEDSSLFIKAVRKGRDDYIELLFEGFVKNHRDTSHTVIMEIVDPETGDKMASSDGDGFTHFTLEKGKDYNFRAYTEDGVEVDVADIRLEGFVKELTSDRVVGDVELKDKETNSILFNSDKSGFFSFPMKNGEEYALNFHMPEEEEKDSEPMDIWVEGFFQGKDSTGDVQMEIQGDDVRYHSDEGFVGFNFHEGEAYHLKVDFDEMRETKKYKFEGFVLDANIPVPSGKILVYDVDTDQLLFRTDESGFFTYLMEEKNNYRITARHAEGVTGESIKLKFDGVVKGEDEELHRANLIIYDTETGKNLVEEDIDGFFSYVLEEGKVYEMKANPVEDPVVDAIVSGDTENGLKTKEFVILYEYNSAEISTDQLADLRKFVKDHLKDERLSVEVTSYADNIGSKNFNRELCLHRNTSVVIQLMKAGVQQNVISAKVGGMLHESCDNCSEEVRKSDRKTVVRFKYQPK